MQGEKHDSNKFEILTHVKMVSGCNKKFIGAKGIVVGFRSADPNALYVVYFGDKRHPEMSSHVFIESYHLEALADDDPWCPDLGSHSPDCTAYLNLDW